MRHAQQPVHASGERMQQQAIDDVHMHDLVFARGEKRAMALSRPIGSIFSRVGAPGEVEAIHAYEQSAGFDRLPPSSWIQLKPWTEPGVRVLRQTTLAQGKIAR